MIKKRFICSGYNKQRSIICLILLIFVLMCFQNLKSESEKLQPGVVIKGAFTLGIKFVKNNYGKLRYPKNGYLPVGTLVYLGEIIKITNYSKEKDKEKYNYFMSENGIEGMIRTDRVLRIGEIQIILPIGNKEIEVYKKNSLPDNLSVLSTFSKSTGAYLKFNNSTIPGLYNVDLSWTKESGIFDVKHIKDNDAKLINLENFKDLERQRAFFSGKKVDRNKMFFLKKIAPGIKVLSQAWPDPAWKKIIEKLKQLSYSKNSFRNIRRHFIKLYRHKCGDNPININDCKHLFQFNDTGLGIESYLNYKDRGCLYGFESFGLYQGDSLKKEFIAFRLINCENDVRGTHLDLFIIQEVNFKNSPPFQIRRSDLPECLLEKCLSPCFCRQNFRMVSVENNYEHQKLVDIILDRIDKAWKNNLSEEQKQAFINGLISEICFLNPSKND